MSRVSSVSGDFSVQLATRLHDWSAGGQLRCSAARLSVCSVVLQIPPIPKRTTCCGQVASIIVASSSDKSDTPDFLVTC